MSPDYNKKLAVKKLFRELYAKEGPQWFEKYCEVKFTEVLLGKQILLDIYNTISLAYDEGCKVDPRISAWEDE
jgi:hypothetical protein